MPKQAEKGSPTAYDLATPEERAFADSVVRALIRDFAETLRARAEKREACAASL